MLDSESACGDSRWAVHYEMIPESPTRMPPAPTDGSGPARPESDISRPAAPLPPGAARVSRIVDGAFYLIYSLVALRLAFALTSTDGTGTVLPMLLALGATALCHAAANGVLRQMIHRKDCG